MKRLKKSVIYVNYSPYENSGKILDFLLENFRTVYLFSIGFHSLDNKKDYNNLSFYQDGNLKKISSLFQFPTSSKYVFLLIPIRSLVTFIEIVLYSIFLKIKTKHIDMYFSANAFTSWIGIVLKSIGVIDKTIFWVWDYYPPIHENKFIMFIRYIYWQFDKVSSHSDIVAFVNKRLLNLRQDIGIYSKSSKYLIVPIGADKLPMPKRINSEKIVFGFIGVLKKTQGLDIIFKHSQEIVREFGRVEYKIVGSGPDEKYFKKLAKKSKIKTTFYGYLEGDSFNEVLSTCTIGIATYTSDSSNVSQYGDPGKIKRYLSLGVPVITTHIIEFAQEIEKRGAGVVIDYADGVGLIEGIKKIAKNNKKYSRNAYKLSQKFYYKKIYPPMFSINKK